MKLLDFALAPNPRKVRVYLAEKGISLPIEAIDVMGGQNRTPEFLAQHPLGGLPVLVLDDGTWLPESLAIIEYLEELHPDPPLIGVTPQERAQVRATERVCELGVLSNLGTIFQHTSPFFAGRVKQSAETAEAARTRLNNNLAALDAMIADKPFVAGSRPTIADCTLFAALELANFGGIEIAPVFGNVLRWHADFKKRPSAAA